MNIKQSKKSFMAVDGKSFKLKLLGICDASSTYTVNGHIRGQLDRRWATFLPCYLASPILP